METKPMGEGQKFSAAEQRAKLERRLSHPQIFEQLRNPAPGEDTRPDYDLRPHDEVTVPRSDGSIDSGWIVDAIHSRPGTKTVVGAYKIIEGLTDQKKLKKPSPVTSYSP